MAKVKAIIFDLDGTLRDTKAIIYDAYNFALDKLTGYIPTETELLPQVHHHLQVHKSFAPDIDKDVFEAVYFDKIKELIPDAKLFLGVNKTLKALKKSGYKLAVVTTAKLEVNEYLKKQDIHHLFDTIVSGKDVERHKPYPDPVLKALERLHLEASEVVMVGDMTVDIQAGKAAKLAAIIGITHGFETREMLNKAGADLIVDSLEEVLSVIVQL